MNGRVVGDPSISHSGWKLHDLKRISHEVSFCRVKALPHKIPDIIPNVILVLFIVLIFYQLPVLSFNIPAFFTRILIISPVSWGGCPHFFQIKSSGVPAINYQVHRWGYDNPAVWSSLSRRWNHFPLPITSHSWWSRYPEIIMHPIPVVRVIFGVRGKWYTASVMGIIEPERWTYQDTTRVLIDEISAL